MGVQFYGLLVGSDHRLHPPAVQMLQNGNPQGGPFSGVGPGAELIQEDQRMLIGMAQEADDVLQMSREGTEVLGNALLITDVDQDLPKQCQRAALLGRNM